MKNLKIFGLILIFVLVFLIVILLIKNSKDDVEFQCLQTYNTQQIYGTGAYEYNELLHKQEFFSAGDLLEKIVDNKNFFSSNGDVLIGVDKDKKNLIVNGKYFSDLKKVDATKVSGQETVGFVRDLSFYNLEAIKIFEFLIQSQIVGTYWHIEANLCLMEQKDTLEIYEAKFEAEHIYYTNEKNVENYSFTFQINKKTGEMKIIGK